jgi:hypothetical protein
VRALALLWSPSIRHPPLFHLHRLALKIIRLRPISGHIKHHSIHSVFGHGVQPDDGGLVDGAGEDGVQRHLIAVVGAVAAQQHLGAAAVVLRPVVDFVADQATADVGSRFLEWGGMHARTGRGIQGGKRRPQAAHPAGWPPPKQP